MINLSGIKCKFGKPIFMPTEEEKIQLILDKLNEKKSRDAWDKAQIVATIMISVFTLLLGSISLVITKRVSEQTTTLQQMQHDDDKENKVRDSELKSREEYVQELAALPTVLKLLGKMTLRVNKLPGKF